MSTNKSKQTKRRKRDPDWFDPEITHPDMPRIKKIIIQKVEEPDFEPEIEESNPNDELMNIELKLWKMRYCMAIERWKISKKHSIKEYAI